MATNYVNFKYGTAAQYAALSTKDNNTLYFVDGVIFKGSTLYGGKVEFVSDLPVSPAQGVIYVLPDYTSKFYTGTEYKTINVGVIGTVEDTTTNDAKAISQGALKAYVSAKLAEYGTSTDVDGKIAAAKSEAISAAEADATTKANKALEDAKTYTDTTVNEAKTELEATINNKVASVFRFKGSKDSLTEVQALTDMVTGDVWHTNDDGNEYVYTGTAWELLGFTIDLSSYATTESVTTAINNKATEIINTINAYSKSEVDGLIDGVKSDLTTHTSNTTIHITADERTAWNAKATTDQVATAKSEAISAAEADATTKANKALEDAKTYANGLNTAMDTRVSAVETAIEWKTIS